MLGDVRSGEAGIVIGTHALIQDTVEFDDLGLVVVDEQHRFGVEQRDALRTKAERPPHTLVMTATPIPRTVAMTVFGDLDVSTLTELPLGRAPIVTHVVPAGEKPHFLERAWERVREEAAKGHQAYVVCPRIGDDPNHPSAAEDEEEEDAPYLRLVPDLPDESRKVNRPPAVAVLEVAELLQDGPLAGLRVSVLHGRMPPEDKEDVMRRFTAGEIDVLVATTIIEVGVDVANATAMVVMDADRFGVSQLHQLRGRIGRGEAAGLCLLVTDMPDGAPARERLDAVAATLDGFELSRVDLSQRREGDVLGASQSGRRSSLKLLRVIRDEDVIVTARAEAEALLAEDPRLDHHVGLRVTVAALVDAERADYLEKA
jgi:ATP-dependent DNA helicase RecG